MFIKIAKNVRPLKMYHGTWARCHTTCIYIYIHIYICICVYMCISVYVWVYIIDHNRPTKCMFTRMYILQDYHGPWKTCHDTKKKQAFCDKMYVYTYLKKDVQKCVFYTLHILKPNAYAHILQDYHGPWKMCHGTPVQSHTTHMSNHLMPWPSKKRKRERQNRKEGREGETGLSRLE